MQSKKLIFFAMLSCLPVLQAMEDPQDKGKGRADSPSPSPERSTDLIVQNRLHALESLRNASYPQLLEGYREILEHPKEALEIVNQKIQEAENTPTTFYLKNGLKGIMGIATMGAGLWSSIFLARNITAHKDNYVNFWQDKAMPAFFLSCVTGTGYMLTKNAVCSFWNGYNTEKKESWKRAKRRVGALVINSKPNSQYKKNLTDLAADTHGWKVPSKDELKNIPGWQRASEGHTPL